MDAPPQSWPSARRCDTYDETTSAGRMCGIAGIFRTGSSAVSLPTDRHRTLKMLERLAHRGPDDEGVCTMGSVTLGTKRLAIVDRANGTQPIFDDAGSALCFNGEIYNSVELRRDLERRGHRFTGHCDSEVLYHLLCEHGATGLESLIGMFALAFYDARRRSLLLAVDPFGIKPVFWTRQNDEVLFAS